MYCTPNFQTKKALREAVQRGEHVQVFRPGLPTNPPLNGEVDIEGPHSPQLHTWYAQATLTNGIVTKVK